MLVLHQNFLTWVIPESRGPVTLRFKLKDCVINNKILKLIQKMNSEGKQGSG